MKKKSKKIISCVIGTLVIGGIVLGAGYALAERILGDSFHLEYTKKDISAPIGSKENIFTILEVVPNESMAQMGYLIPGCEPVDMEKLAVSPEISTYKVDMAREDNMIAVVEEKESCRFTDALTTEDKVISYVKMNPDFPYTQAGNELLLDAALKEVIDSGKMETYKENVYGVWIIDQNYKYSEYGYYENVGENKGIFKLMQAEDGSYVFEPVGAGKGSYNWVGTGCYYKDGTKGEYNRTENQRQIMIEETNWATHGADRKFYTYARAEGGEYHYQNFHDAEEEPQGRPDNSGAVEKVGDKYWTTRTDMYSYTYKYNQITNKDLLIQQTFPGRATETGFQSQVLTVTPTQLNNMPKEEMQELVQTVDLIEFHTATERGLVTIWEKFNRKDKTLTTEEKKIESFKDNDINWDVTIAILTRMASERPAAMIMEEPAMFRDVNPDSNMKKLYLMLMQYGAKSFYNQFVLSGQVTAEIGSERDAMTGEPLTTGFYQNPFSGSKTEWTQETFRLKGLSDGGESWMHEKWLSYGNTETYENIFVYNGNQSMVQCFLSQYVKNFTAESGATVSDAFEYFYEKDGEGSHAQGLNTLDFMEYILRGISGGWKEKTHLNILEVQPCNTFIYGSENWKLYYMNLVPWFKGTGTDMEKDFTVTTMPTWEFIGKIDDINAQYDFIVFGGNQDASNGINGYNDVNMNGLVYSSIGDLVTAEQSNNYNRWVTFGVGGKYVVGDDIIRYSGNDLTEKKYKELVSYLKGEQAVVIDGSLYQNDAKNVNSTKVDSSSIFYRLANLTVTGAEEGAGRNIFVTTARRQSEMKPLVAYEKCELEFYTGDGGTGYPTEYTYEEGTGETIAPGTIRYVDNGMFTYSFKINGRKERNYGISLYIDRNGDGLYNGSLVEQVSGNSNKSEEIKMQITTQDGQKVANGELKADTWYVASRRLPSNYAGILPWKLETYDVQNPNIRNSVIKYSAVKTTSANREKIKVLEMTLTPNMTNASSYYWEGVMYMATTGKHANSQFKSYLDCVEDFQISVDYLENEDWKKLFSNNASYSTEEAKIQAWKDYLDQYDMLILGYCDMCSFSDSKIYQEGFSYFVEMGKSVMISHDMVKDQTYTYQSEEYVTKYDNWLRDLVGQWRYKTDTAKLKGKDIPLLGSQYRYGHRNTGDYTAVISNDDGTKRTVPAYGDNSIALFLKHGLKGYADRVTNDKLIGHKNDGARNYWREENYETSYVNLVNQGQITNYPYKIDGVIEVSKTHCQPCQLDMDKEEMVVWYTLTDQYSKKYQSDISRISGNRVEDRYLGTGVYSSRESDVRNGFYIYNVGNITYTGMGHTRRTSSNRLTPDEMRLYVNTMISAYRAAAAKPYVKITNEDKTESDGDNILYVPYDESVLDQTQDFLSVSFQVTDESIQEIETRSYTLNFCDAGGNVLGTQPVIYDAVTGEAVPVTGAGYAVKRDGAYYFKVPYAELEKQGKMSYYLNLTSSYTNQKNVEIKTSDTTRATVLKMPLFNLN